jgi:hypothetical protein
MNEERDTTSNNDNPNASNQASEQKRIGDSSNEYRIMPVPNPKNKIPTSTKNHLS